MKNYKSKTELENSVDNLIEELKTPLAELNNMQLTQLNLLKSEIDFIVKKNINAKKRIEKDFDMLLNLVY